MDDPLLVGGVQHLGQLAYQPDRLLRLHRRLTPLEVVREQDAFQVGHRQVGLAVVLAHVEDRADVGMARPAAARASR